MKEHNEQSWRFSTRGHPRRPGAGPGDGGYGTADSSDEHVHPGLADDGVGAEGACRLRRGQRRVRRLHRRWYRALALRQRGIDGFVCHGSVSRVLKLTDFTLLPPESMRKCLVFQGV